MIERCGIFVNETILLRRRLIKGVKYTSMTLYFYEADNKKMRNIYTSIRLYPYDTDIVN